MDLVVIAQLLTGVATILVASVLIYQLRIQHKDSVRSFAYQKAEHHLSRMRAVYDNPDFRKIFSSRLYLSQRLAGVMFFVIKGLRKLSYLWIKSEAFPNNLTQHLDLDPNKPICYILRTKALTDLLVLDHHCSLGKLPSPVKVKGSLSSPHKSYPLYTHLYMKGLFRKRNDHSTDSVHHIIERYKKTGQDLQLVPVSIFWGRNPGKGHKTLLQLLFFDSDPSKIIFGFNIIPVRLILCRINSSKHFFITSDVFFKHTSAE